MFIFFEYINQSMDVYNESIPANHNPNTEKGWDKAYMTFEETLENISEEDNIYYISNVVKEIFNESIITQPQRQDIKRLDLLRITKIIHESSRDINTVEDFKDSIERINNENIDFSLLDKILDEIDLIEEVLETLRKFSEILEDYTDTNLGVASQSQSLANSVATFNSLYALLYSLYNFVEVCVEIEEEYSESETIDEENKVGFVRSLSLVVVEFIFITTPISYQFAWRSTRFTANNGLYRLRQASNPAYRLILSRIHYTYNQGLEQVTRYILDEPEVSLESFFEMLVDTTKTTFLVELIHKKSTEFSIDLEEPIKEVYTYILDQVQSAKKYLSNTDDFEEIQDAIEEINIDQFIDLVQRDNESTFIEETIIDGITNVKNQLKELFGGFISKIIDILSEIIEIYQSEDNSIESPIKSPQTKTITVS